MRRNRKNNIRKERAIMIASSAFVLAALTLTGVYLKGEKQEKSQEEYTLDFTALDKAAGEAENQVAQGKEEQEQLADNSTLRSAEADKSDSLHSAENIPLTEDELDYIPLEAGSGQIEIPGLTQKEQGEEEELLTNPEEAWEETAASSITVEKELHFTEEEGLISPVEGDILLHYSMDKSIYFQTLDQYKYNPAVILAAQEGAEVKVCADARVTEIYENEEIGNAVTLDLGDGYQATYGQLADIRVTQGASVNAGDTLGSVASPTKYYSVEGSNVYFQLMRQEEPVNPEPLF